MAAITPTNGRVAFLALQNPHTYYELQDGTNGGINYGSAGTGDNVNVSGQIGTSGSYSGLNAAETDFSNHAFDVYIVTDAAMLLYLPAGLSHGQVYGIFHNGGGTHAQSIFVRATATGIEIAVTHNASGTPQDNVIYEIPDADLPGWFAVSGQFASSGGSQGDMALWVNGTKVRSGTRTTQLQYGSGNPQLGDSNADHPLESACLDPSDYSGGNWGAEATINGSGILIANFTVDNPSNDNTSPNGAGDTFHSDYYDTHTVSAGSEEGAGSGSLMVAGTATGQRTGQGSAAGTVIFAATATGTKEENLTGQASGTVEFAGNAQGLRTAVGQASGTATFAGTSEGQRTAFGGAAGNVAFTATAAGNKQGNLAGSGSAAAEFAATGSGLRTGRNSATGAVTFAGSATGQRTTTGAASGSGVAEFTAMASGVRVASATATASVLFAATANGQRTAIGTANSVAIFAWAATGRRTTFATATGELIVLADASGLRLPNAVGLIDTSGRGSTVLDLRPLGSGPVSGSQTSETSAGGVPIETASGSSGRVE